MKRFYYYATCLLLLSVNFAWAAETYQINKLTFLEVNSSINPATYNYLENSLKKLKKENGDLAFIKLDTPGGLVTTTKDILTLIGSLDIPIGIWITPEGASATSAGSIIASSAHLLVMSEGTNIGAATPIGMGNDIQQKDARSKAINDLVALVKSLSKARGRNPIHFEKMISEAKSIDARTALKDEVIDGIINSQTELIEFINKQKVTIKGTEYTLQIEPSVPVKTVEMDAGQQILNIFANPTTAYVLFIIGAALIYFELQAPGGFVAGALGVVFLFLAGIGFQVLPLNIGAMGLIILSFILFILEAYITSFGILTLAGIAALVFGSLFLFRTDDSMIDLERNVVFSVIFGIVLYVGFLGWFFVKTWIKHKNYYTNAGEEGHITKLLGEKDGVYHYQVKVKGEIWNAESKDQFNLNDEIKVDTSNEEKLILTITKK